MKLWHDKKVTLGKGWWKVSGCIKDEQEFTVIGHYDDSGEIYFVCLKAETAEKAALMAANLHDEDDLEISAVIAGKHENLMLGDHIQHVKDILDSYEDIY